MSTTESNEIAPTALAPPRDVAPDKSSSAPGNVPSPTARTEAGPLDGPVVLAQPPVVGTSAPVARSGSTESGTASETAKPALAAVKTAFTNAQAAVSSGYRTVAASTDEFAHESPWKSIAFAALGGIVIGMLIAR
jgi:ElaB/YqjD/DUF883 family membrane-anchored ribosome-binding protein